MAELKTEKELIGATESELNDEADKWLRKAKEQKIRPDEPAYTAECWKKKLQVERRLRGGLSIDHPYGVKNNMRDKKDILTLRRIDEDINSLDELIKASKLTYKQEFSFRMHFIEGHTYREIGVMLKCSKQAVSNKDGFYLTAIKKITQSAIQNEWVNLHALILEEIIR